MILESRSIIFSDEELVLALRPLLASRGLDVNTIPTSVDISLGSKDEVNVTYKINGKDDPLVFNDREVGAAVLNHCIEQGIPLPRGSYKELTTRGDHIALIVRIQTGSDGTGIEDDEE